MLRWAVFPALILGSVAATWAGLASGAPAFAVVAGVNFAVAAIVLVLERTLPYAPEWNEARGDVWTDAAHMLLSTGVVPLAFRALCYGSLAAAAASLSRAVGAPLWPATWPAPAQLAIALVVADLGAYWAHRWAHGVDFLWRLHATHHSAERLYWLNAGRFHPLDNLVGYALEVSPLVLLGAGADVLSLFTVYTAVNGVLRHANVDMRFGRLNWIFSTADLHRWHHSRDIAEASANYAPNLMLWDVVFGTRFLPAGRRPSTDIGIADMPGFPTGYLAQLAIPFRWPRR